MHTNRFDIRRLLGSAFRAAGISLSSGRRLLSRSSLIPVQTGIQSLVVLLLMPIAIGTAEAREWSEEVQMTNSGDHQARCQFFGAVVDSRDVLHVSYYYNRGNGQPGDHQPVYQQFNKHGEPLTDPIMVGEFFDWDDEAVKNYDLYLDANEDIHLLWGSGTDNHLYHTMFNRDGDHLVSCLLQGIRVPSEAGMGVPHIVVESQGRLVVVSRTEFYDQENQRHYYYLSYGRWTFEGELIDTLHSLTDDTTGAIAFDPEICLDEGDTLYFTWHDYDRNGWRLAKIDPDDQQAIGPQELSGRVNDPSRHGVSSMLLDSQNRVTFVSHGESLYLTQFATDFNVRFDRHLDSHHSLMGGTISSGINENILFLSTIVYGFGDYGTVFEEFSTDGEVVDSLQLITRHLVNRKKAVVFSDSSVATIWSDDRFYRETRNQELFMVYSLSPNRVIDLINMNLPENPAMLSAYPNPFNSSVTIPFSVGARHAVPLRLAIYGLDGRVVAELIDGRGVLQYAPTSGGQVIWSASGFPAGEYFIRLESAKNSAMRKVVLVK